MKKYIYEPQGICSHLIEIKLDGDKLQSVLFHGGCPGNHLGINALCKGMKIDDVIKRLKGIKCGTRLTSCPDQLAIALESIKNGKIKESK